MKKILFIMACLLFSIAGMASITVTGTVISAEDGLPVIGASVLEKGTSNGTITDFDGMYALTVADNAVLVFSYVGLTSQELKVSGSVMNVTLKGDAIAMEEVVVTAMGVVQEKKRLNFAVQNVGAEGLTEGKSANVLNSLQGKVAGVNVTTAGGSPNAGSQLIIRGVTSISSTQSNEPLVVLDGMPLTGGAGDINPNDIESITVLKGAAASALYGQEAANGVLMITTKSGTSGKLTATVNGSWQFDTPANLLQLQNMYMPGSNGFYREQTKNGWGPVLGEGVQTYNNVRNYFKDFGFYHKYDISLSGGTDKFQSVASISYSNADGIVVNDYRQKVTAMLKGSYSPNKYITMSMMANIIHNKYRSAGGISSIYSWPINDDIRNYETESGDIRFLYFADEKANSPFSPLYARYHDQGVNKSTRTLLTGFVTVKPVKGLEITARLSMDQNNYNYDGYSVPRFSDTNLAPEPNITDPYLTQEQLDKIDKSALGSYSNSQSESRLLTGNLLATYHLALPKDFALDFMLGGELKDRSSLGTSVSGTDFIIPGVYSVQNLKYINGTDDVSVSHTQRRNAGVYGEIRGDYKGLATLSFTTRWDWSSTLKQELCPYWYPSVTAGLIFSELIPGLNETKDNWFSYGKLRGNFAMVGKDAPAYLMDRRFTQFATLPDGGYSVNASASVGHDIIPEISKSWEIGMDLRFLDNRLRLDAAYYSQITENQIVTVRVSHAAGYVLQTRNEGTVKNHGLEFTLDGDIVKRNGWTWTAGLNIGLNRGTVLKLPEGMVEIQGTQYGDIFPTAYLNGSTTAISGKDYLRTEDGKIICDENGYPQINPAKGVLIGNREPLVMAGLNTSLKYKGLSIGLQFDGRIGGDVVNVTARSLWSSGMHPAIPQYRGRQVVWDGVVQTGTDANGNPIYEQNTKPIVLDATTISNYYYGVSSNFLEDGSYIRLQYATIAYDFGHLLKNVKGIESVRLSFTGTNLFLLTKYTGSDPQTNANTSGAGTGSAGIDNYAIPNTRGYNMAVQVTF